jgi:hypothetical protein
MEGTKKIESIRSSTIDDLTLLALTSLHPSSYTQAASERQDSDIQSNLTSCQEVNTSLQQNLEALRSGLSKGREKESMYLMFLSTFLGKN